MNASTLLENAVANGGLRELDRYFAERMAALDGRSDNAFSLVLALLSQQVGEGHVCIDLQQWAGQPLFATEDWPGLDAPAVEDSLATLTNSELVSDGGANTPMVLQGSRLYLGRYWRYENDLAEALLAKAAVPISVSAEAETKALLALLFAADDHPNRQAVAAALAQVRPLTVISGGPGTGKTHTVAAILAMLCKHGDVRIALAAPTGKAAVRLSQSIHKAKSDLAQKPGLQEVIERIPEQAQTLHRLLGVRPGRVQADYCADNPLHVDVLVVDEASMISLPMMAKMLAALPAHARLILLGDKDQLASVEAGSVFADLCAGGAAPHYSESLNHYLQQVLDFNPGPEQNTVSGAVADSLVLLRKSYRFSGDSGINALAQAINSGDGKASASVLQSGFDDLQWQNPPMDRFEQVLGKRAVAGFSAALSAPNPEAALAAMNQFRILSALRVGPTGVEAVNVFIEQALAKAGLIANRGGLYRGRPIMVTENAPALNLFNGDMGVVWPDPQSGVMRVWFADSQSGVRSLSVARLPRHETAYAMTVHKSQGSEFDTLLLLLPYQDSPVLSRELLYTGVTRAVKRCEVWAAPEVFMQACKRRISRASGLAEKLYS